MSAGVVVNGRFLQRRVTGVERYAAETLACLGNRVQIILPRRSLQGSGGHGWEQFILPHQVPEGALLWSPANTGPLAVSNQVLTVCDLSPLENPQWFSSTFALWYRLLWPLLVRRVRKVITLSACVRQKIIRRFNLAPERVVQIPAGVDTHRFRPLPHPVAERYVLFVGTLEPRKNLPVLLEAWNQIKRAYPTTKLLIAGGRSRIFQEQHFSQDMDQVSFLGYVADEELPALYARAAVFVMPSLDEGFSLPVLEAMACGTPIIASRAGALPETVGEAGLFFDPREPQALAGLIGDCLNDASLRASLRERGLARASNFPWTSTAQKIWEALKDSDGD